VQLIVVLCVFPVIGTRSIECAVVTVGACPRRTPSGHGYVSTVVTPFVRRRRSKLKDGREAVVSFSFSVVRAVRSRLQATELGYRLRIYAIGYIVHM